MKLLLALTLAASLLSVTSANANLRSVKQDVNYAIDDCDSNSYSQVRSANCLENKIENLVEDQYDKASYRNNNRLICTIVT